MCDCCLSCGVNNGENQDFSLNNSGENQDFSLYNSGILYRDSLVK